MLKHLKKHWRSWAIVALCVALFAFVAVNSDVFKECINRSYYESSDHEPPKGFALIVSNLGWAKACAGEFFLKDGEAITAFFTLILGIATIGLWISTRELWRAGEKQSRAIYRQSSIMSSMADAAANQVEIIALQTDIQKKQHAIGRLQFLAEHRPRLRIRHVNIPAIARYIVGSWPIANGEEMIGGLVLVNAGGTKATIVDSRYRIWPSTIGLPAGETPYDGTNFRTFFPEPTEIQIGESIALPIKDIILDLGPDDIYSTQLTVFVMGQITYRDEAGTERFIGFCRERQRDGSFRAVNDPDYEYED